MSRKLGFVAVGLAVLIGGAIAWWSLSYPSYSYRYRLAVEVEADGKLHNGASVIEVTITKQPNWGSAPPQRMQVEGEAVFVDLGDGRNVIALLARGPNASDVDYPSYITTELFGLSYADRDLVHIPSMQGSRAIPDGLLPTFVTFADLNDPKTARVVQPHEFSQVFGEANQVSRRDGRDNTRRGD